MKTICLWDNCLVRAVALLNSIPGWCGHYQVEELMSQHDIRSSICDTVPLIPVIKGIIDSEINITDDQMQMKDTWSVHIRYQLMYYILYDVWYIAQRMIHCTMYDTVHTVSYTINRMTMIIDWSMYTDLLSVQSLIQ